MSNQDRAMNKPKTVARKSRPQAMSTKLDAIHHVAIPVPDVARAVEWYTSRFNCEVEYIDESWALLAFANTKLALVLPQEHPSHFAITRSDAHTFGNLVRHRDGLHSVYITDLFNNSIEVLEEP